MRQLLLVALLLLCMPAWGSASRIVTLSPHLAELVFLVGAGDRLVGVSEYSDYPEAARSIPRIGGAVGVDTERLLSLSPDLVLAWQGGTREADIAHLRRLGLNVVEVRGETLNDIPASLLLLGRLTETSKTARRAADNFNNVLQSLEQKYLGVAPKSIYIEVSSHPLMALSSRHAFSAGLEVCRAENIFAELSRPSAIVSIEAILTRQPQYVLMPDSVSMADALASLARYRQGGEGQEMKLIRFDANRAFRQTPRLLDTVSEVCSALH
jgi:ABC-type Fe3+-hydroxamate transport system substrate-binding protein